MRGREDADDGQDVLAVSADQGQDQLSLHAIRNIIVSNRINTRHSLILLKDYEVKTCIVIYRVIVENCCQNPM